MRLFRRISSTVLASVDKVITEVENHDAVVESMLKELKTASAECKVRLNRVMQDGKKMQEDLDKLTETEQLWTERASQLANDTDQESQNKALACLERRQKCRVQQKLLNERLAQHAIIQTQLKEQLLTIDNRFAEINDKRHLLQSQQAVAEANRVVSAATGAHSSDIDATLDRWEVSIAKMDVHASHSMQLGGAPHENIDELAQEFETNEANAALLAELKELQSSDKK
ncbi:MAG: PspA/IM30 family protein [Arenicella sp.]